MDRKPNFQNLLKVLKKEKPDRQTLFEFFMNDRLYKRFSGKPNNYDWKNDLDRKKSEIETFYKLGYDYSHVQINDIPFFPRDTSQHRLSTKSANEGVMIKNENDFNAYHWGNPNELDYNILNDLNKNLHEGMKFIVSGPGGIFENIIALLGYDNLCYLLADNPDFVSKMSNKIGGILTEYYKNVCKYDNVGACIVNDDWGFKSGLMMSIKDMNKYIIPWHKKMVQVIHEAGKPAILHSCGQLKDVFDEIVDEIGFDGKHSYEDNIIPVEDAYKKYSDRIAIMGGIDVDFLIRSSVDDIHKRVENMLTLTNGKAYALGSGNSIPEYIPDEKYFAMLEPVIGKIS